MKFLTIICLLCVAAVAAAQSNIVFEGIYSDVDSSICNGKPLRLRLSNINFFKNNEYFGDYIEGYTLLGYKVQPSIVYQIEDNLSIEGGAQFLQYGGTDKYDKIYPILLAQWRINETFKVNMGAIKGGYYHHLPEAILNPEKQLSGRPETGVQIEANHKGMSGEVWIDWQSFIFKGDTIPERFMAGLRFNYSPKTESAWQFEMPICLTASHIGGQISDYAERMQSLANGSATFRFTRKIENRKYIGTEIEGLFFYTMTGGDVRPFENGWAIYPKINACYNIFDANVGYYHAHDFFSLHGNPLFMSLSDYNSAVYTADRNMLTFEANLNHQISSKAQFSLGAKGYYDIDASQMEYYYGFYLVIRTP